MSKNSLDLLKLIKKASVDSVNAKKPVNILYGVVLAKKPLQVQIEQKLILEESQLVLTRNVTDYSVNMIVDHQTESVSGGSGDSSFSSHSHKYSGEKTFSVLNALQEGEKVVLFRIQDGQKYIILDRVGAIWYQHKTAYQTIK